MPTPGPSRGSLIGRTLAGNYFIERKLGDGGMGTVYAARHTRLPARLAVKVLHEELSTSDELFQRFRQEAEITSSLRHPNIVQVTDFNRLEDGTIYLVMEYLEGESLHEHLLKRGRLPVTEALALARQVGSGLTAAHKHNVVHRDLKPQNIFLAQEDHGERMVEVVKLLDFGISKILREAQEQLTRVGRILGTPQFMAPEQARGHNQLVDGRTDQFAMGSILYYALSGHLPFAGAEPSAVIYQVLFETPPPLHHLMPVAPAISEALERAMAKEPGGRYSSISEFLRALEVGSQGTVIAAQAVTKPTSLPGLRAVPAPAPPPVPEAQPTVVFEVPGAEGRAVPGPGAAAPALQALPALDTAGPLQAAGFATTLSRGTGAMERVLPPERLVNRRAALVAVCLLALALSFTGFLLRGPADPARVMTPAAAPAPDHPALPPAVAPARPVPGAGEAQPSPPPGSAPPPSQPADDGKDGAELSRLLEGGEARLKDEDLPAARAAFEQALQKGPRNARAMAGLGSVEIAGRNYAGAERWLREAVVQEPAEARYHLLLCQARFRLGALSAARASCARVLQLDPAEVNASLILRAMQHR